MENLCQVIKERHSVREYTDQLIEGSVKEKLEKIIEECNKEGALTIKLITEEPNVFHSFMAHYGKFYNVKNYIVMMGKNTTDLEEKCGYYGEKIVLRAQELGLNTCWVGLTYNKNKIPCKVEKGQKLVIVISIGYGVNQGTPHQIKSFEDVSITKGKVPAWYQKGIEYALLAPTALNQQKFRFELIGENKVKAVSGSGFFTKVDLGIAKYHFELGAGKEIFEWINED